LSFWQENNNCNKIIREIKRDFGDISRFRKYLPKIGKIAAYQNKKFRVFTYFYRQIYYSVPGEEFHMHDDPFVRRLTEPYSCDLLAKWNKFLNQQTCGSFFQSPDYVALFSDCSNYKPLVIVTENPEEAFTGILVAFIITDHFFGIPFQRILVHGGPVISEFASDSAGILRTLLSALKSRIPPKTVFVEIRNLQLWGEHAVIFQESGFAWHDHLNDILSVHDKNQVFQVIKPAKQRQIRRGIENGAIIHTASSLSEVEALYALLLDLYRKKVRKPLPPIALFKNFYEKIQLENKGVVLIVKYKNQVIGGMVCPFSGNNTVHEWYICSMQNRLKHLYPGVLATWAGIDYAMQHKFRYFDFMGMGSPQKPYGVRDFKTKFGGEVINFGRWQLINNKFRYQLGLFGYYILKKFSSS
jgi:hypothetical protein